MKYLEPKLLIGDKFQRDGIDWEVRGISTNNNEVTYFAIPFGASCSGLNYAPIFVRETDIA